MSIGIVGITWYAMGPWLTVFLICVSFGIIGFMLDAMNNKLLLR